MGCGYAASKMFSNANKFIEAYHTVLQPLCKQLGLPPLAINILMFLANNPDQATAMEVCRCRGLKPGIVSVHIERLVADGLLVRQSVPGDRRKTRLLCTQKAVPVVEQGRQLQQAFAERLLSGMSQEELDTFRHCLSILDKNIDDIRNSGIETEVKEC